MKRASLVAGVLAFVLIWGGPLLSVWRESFAAHMLAHMGVVAIAAPLIAIGISDRMPPLNPALAVVASLVELVVVWGWHMPAARQWAETSLGATILEQGMFLAAGLLLWLTSFALARTAAQLASGAFALLLTSIHMTLLGALLSLASRPLYGAGEVTCFGVVLDARQDQTLGGVTMLAVGAAVYLAGGIILLSRLLDGRGEKAPEGSSPG